MLPECDCVGDPDKAGTRATSRQTPGADTSQSKDASNRAPRDWDRNRMAPAIRWVARVGRTRPTRVATRREVYLSQGGMALLSRPKSKKCATASESSEKQCLWWFMITRNSSNGLKVESCRHGQLAEWSGLAVLQPTRVATRREVFPFQAFETSCDFVTSVGSWQTTEATLR